MADSACYIELASNAGDFFTNAAQDDILIHPHYATQRILLGTSNSQIPSITVTSNAVGILKSSPAYPLDVIGDINLTGTFRKNGAPYIGSQWSNNNSNVFLADSSNVGIGTSNPYERLIVGGNALVASNDAYFSVTAPGVSPSLGICKKSGIASMFVFTSNYNNSFTNHMKFGMLTGTHLSNIATVSPVEYMVLTNSGNLGIGNSAPAYKLDVNGTTKTNIFVSGSNSSFYSPSIPVQAFSASDGSQSIQLNAPFLTMIRHGTTAWSLVGPSNGRTRFSINDTSTGNPGLEYFTILQSGNVGIENSNPVYKLDVSGGSMRLSHSNDVTGRTNTSLYVVNTSTAATADAQIWCSATTNTGGGGSAKLTLENLGQNAYSIGVDRNDSGKFKLANHLNDIASNVLLTVDTTGNVGIGVGPSYKLDVAASNTTSTQLRITQNGQTTGRAGLMFTQSNTSYTMQYVANNTVFEQLQAGDVGFYNYGTFSIYDKNNANAARLRVQADGKMGVGTNNVGYQLTVDASSQASGANLSIFSYSNMRLWMVASDIAGRVNGMAKAGDMVFAALSNVTDTGGMVLGPWTNCNYKGIRIDGATGYVGVGTNNAGYPLDIAGTTRSTNYYIGTGAGVGAGDIRAADFSAFTYDTSNVPAYGAVWRFDSANSNAPMGFITGFGGLRFFTGSIPRLTILGTGSTGPGNVGIGTSNPAYKLDVNGDINYTGTLYKSGVALGTSQWTSSACNVYVGSTSNVGIGTTVPGYTLHVVGTIYTSGDIIAFSDERAKSNLEVISEPLSKVRQLTGYTYDMTETTSDTTKLTSKYTGLIAQEVMQVLPEAVHKDTDGKLSIAYGNIMGLVVEAIKAIDDKYKEEIQTLKNQMAQVLAKS